MNFYQKLRTHSIHKYIFFTDSTVLNVVKQANLNIENIASIFMRCITIFENFLQNCRIGLNQAVVVNNNTAFTDSKKIVNKIIGDMQQLVGITENISKGFTKVNKNIGEIKPHIGNTTNTHTNLFRQKEKYCQN